MQKDRLMYLAVLSPMRDPSNRMPARIVEKTIAIAPIDAVHISVYREPSPEARVSAAISPGSMHRSLPLGLLPTIPLTLGKGWRDLVFSDEARQPGFRSARLFCISTFLYRGWRLPV